MEYNPDLPSPASVCPHREIPISKHQTICSKCGRMRVKTPEADFFYYCNGVAYLTRRKQ